MLTFIVKQIVFFLIQGLLEAIALYVLKLMMDFWYCLTDRLYQ